MQRCSFAQLSILLAAGTAISASDARAQLAALPLDLRVGAVDTSAANGAGALADQPVGARMVVQLDGPITPARRTALEAAGLHVGDYLPTNAYIVTLKRAGAEVKAPDFVRWSSLYQSTWKLDPELGTRTYTSQERQALRAKSRDVVVATVFAGVDTGSVERAVWAIRGAAVRSVESGAGGHMEVYVEIADADVSRLAMIPGVQFVEPAPDCAPRSNYTTRWIVQSNVTASFPLYNNGLHGEGQIVGIIDGAVDQNHCSFKDTVPVGPAHRKIVGYNGGAAADLHGTHVGGTAVGNDPTSADTANTRGIAYLGKLSWSPTTTYTTPDLTNGFAFNHAAGARVHTNSWGNDGTTSYDSLARAIDDLSYNNEDDMICFAVSNGSVVTNPENAKDVLAVGNDSDTPNQGNFCTGGTGPTGQGLRKPEIWAPGCSTQSSSAGTTCGTTSLTGTSMASPAIAGTALLVRQYFTAGYYGTGVAGTGTAMTPSGALIRAVMTNSSVDMSASGYPGNREGWGRILADNALFFPGDARKLIVKDVRNAAGLATNDINTTSIQVQSLSQQLRVTLAFTEPPGTAGSGTPTVNNLDLEVVDPVGATYKGNVFNTAAGVSMTGGTADAKNTIEQVHVTNPTVGQWTVRVKGASVAQALQGFALVITGDVALPGNPPCYVNCDGSTTPPVLTANDFQCFLNKFAANDSTANCDGSTTAPVLTANDFQCFLNAYAAGCS